MTTIAYRFPYLAADSLVRQSSVRVAETDKIFRLDDGRLFAASGDLSSAQAALVWLNKGGSKPSFRENSGLDAMVVAADGSIVAYDDDLVPMVMRGDFLASGSGGDFALAAMAMGADAVKAVEVACRFDTGSAPPIQVWDVRTGQRVLTTDTLLAA